MAARLHGPRSMRLSLVARAVRRAALLSLGTQSLVACGARKGVEVPEGRSGTPIAETTGASGGPSDASIAETADGSVDSPDAGVLETVEASAAPSGSGMFETGQACAAPSDADLTETADAGRSPVDAGPCDLASRAELCGSSICGYWAFPFHGSPASCRADDAGNLPSSLCYRVCPLTGESTTICNLGIQSPASVGPDDPYTGWAIYCYNGPCGTGR